MTKATEKVASGNTSTKQSKESAIVNISQLVVSEATVRMLCLHLEDIVSPIRNGGFVALWSHIAGAENTLDHVRAVPTRDVHSRNVHDTPLQGVVM
jgi:hypothetical protein